MRAVTADHVLFDEAILAFRPRKAPKSHADSDLKGQVPLTTYLLLDFALAADIVCGNFRLRPTTQIVLPGAHAAFIAPLDLPPHLDRDSGHPFGIAVSCLVSFATGRPTHAPRDPYFLGRELDSQSTAVLALKFPVLVAGPGAHESMLSGQTLNAFARRIQEVDALLRALPWSEFARIIRAMRLVQLAHNVFRDDFALAYYLLVSAIETIARRAISRREVAERHDQEDKWEQAAIQDPVVSAVLRAYRYERGKNQYLRKRFVKYVLRYCPPREWLRLEHPLADIKAHLDTLGHTGSTNHLVRKHWFELYPEDLPEPLIEGILGNLYTYRSIFTHEGKAPPHRNPISYNRYFDEELEFDEDSGEVRRLILPNYRLVAFIAQQAILAFGKGLRHETESSNPGA